MRKNLDRRDRILPFVWSSFFVIGYDKIHNHTRIGILKRGVNRPHALTTQINYSITIHAYDPPVDIFDPYRKNK